MHLMMMMKEEPDLLKRHVTTEQSIYFSALPLFVTRRIQMRTLWFSVLNWPKGISFIHPLIHQMILIGKKIWLSPNSPKYVWCVVAWVPNYVEVAEMLIIAPKITKCYTGKMVTRCYAKNVSPFSHFLTVGIPCNLSILA